MSISESSRAAAEEIRDAVVSRDDFDVLSWGECAADITEIIQRHMLAEIVAKIDALGDDLAGMWTDSPSTKFIVNRKLMCQIIRRHLLGDETKAAGLQHVSHDGLTTEESADLIVSLLGERKSRFEQSVAVVESEVWSDA